MTRIYYDEDDKEAIQLIDDYYFFKYMVKMIYNDWRNVAYSNDDDQVNPETIRQIMSCLNKMDIERLDNIIIKLPNGTKFYSNVEELIDWMFDDYLDCRGESFEINCFKHYLIEKYGNPN